MCGSLSTLSCCFLVWEFWFNVWINSHSKICLDMLNYVKINYLPLSRIVVFPNFPIWKIQSSINILQKCCLSIASGLAIKSYEMLNYLCKLPHLSFLSSIGFHGDKAVSINLTVNVYPVNKITIYGTSALFLSFIPYHTLVTDIYSK